MRITKYALVLLATLLCGLCAEAQTDRQLIRQGNRLFFAKNYVKAEVAYRKALAKNGANTQALYNIGCALLMQNRDSAALEYFKQAARSEKITMRKSKSYHNIGVIFQAHKMYGEAIEAYKASLRLNPTDDQTRYNLALCKRLLKNNPQQNKNQNKNKNENKNDKDKQNKNKNQNKKDKNRQQPNEEKMSKDNAQQLLNAAMQQEEATQRKINNSKVRPQKRNLDKNW